MQVIKICNKCHTVMWDVNRREASQSLWKLCITLQFFYKSKIFHNKCGVFVFYPKGLVLYGFHMYKTWKSQTYRDRHQIACVPKTQVVADCRAQEKLGGQNSAGVLLMVTRLPEFDKTDQGKH